MPKIKIIFHEGDSLFKIKLDAILNQTENDKELFASVQRDPEFINRIRNSNEYDVTSLLGMALATFSLIGVIYLLIKLRKLILAIMVLQTQLTTVVKALDNLQLTQRPKPTEITQPNIHEAILNISTNYWSYLIAMLIFLAVARKSSKMIWNKCTSIFSKIITESSIILYTSNGRKNVYLKIQDTNERQQSLNIQSTTYLSKAEISGYMKPILKYTWDASICNSLDQQTIPIKEMRRLSQYEAYITRKVVTEAFHCHLLLLQDDKLDIIARVNSEILPALQKLKTMQAPSEYPLVSVPRSKIYPSAPHYKFVL